MLCISASVHRETKEVLALQMKKGNRLGRTSYLRDLLIPSEHNILVLLGIHIGVIGMVGEKIIKVHDF